MSRVLPQALASAIALGCVFALFQEGQPTPNAVAPHIGKSTARVAGGVVPSTSFTVDPLEFAAAQSNVAQATVAQTIVAPPVETAPLMKTASVVRARTPAVAPLPPRRPAQIGFADAAAPAPAAVSADTSADRASDRGWRIAGVAIPTVSIATPSMDLGRYIPSGDDVMQTFSRARAALISTMRISSR